MVFAVVAFSFGQTLAPKSETKKGWFTQYYNQSDTVHFKGKIKNDLREGRWDFFSYSTTGTQVNYQFFNYVAGVKEGAFQSISGDTLERGAYQADQLHGLFERYRFTIAATGDTTLVPLDKGEYGQGTMIGKWQHFKQGRLAEQGSYFVGKKDKKWSYYAVELQGNDVWKTITYKQGQKHGVAIEHFQLKTEKVDCANGAPGPCYSYEKAPIYTEKNWYTDILAGEYFVKDKDGFVIESGSYVQGKKNGEVFTYDRETQMKCKSNYMDGVQSGPAQFLNRSDQVTIKGGFLDGKRNGKWTWIDPESGSKTKEMTYDNGTVNGDYFEYYDNGNEREFRKIEQGTLVELTHFATDGETVLTSYEIAMDEPSAGWMTIHYSHAHGDSVENMTYEMKAPESLTHDQFEEAFKKSKVKQGATYLSGVYELYIGGKLLMSGNYTKNEKDGLWDYWYSETVLWQVTYAMGKVSQEYFKDKSSGEAFKGEYIINFSNGKPRFVFKIKEGLKHGKCFTYDVDGMILLEEKYKAGILVE